MFHIIWYIVVGFVVGLAARAILPGVDHMGVVATTAVGLVGSILGGYLGHWFSKPAPGARFHRAGFIMSIVGAIVLLLVLRFV